MNIGLKILTAFAEFYNWLGVNNSMSGIKVLSPKNSYANNRSIKYGWATIDYWGAVKLWAEGHQPYYDDYLNVWAYGKHFNDLGDMVIKINYSELYEEGKLSADATDRIAIIEL